MWLCSTHIQYVFLRHISHDFILSKQPHKPLHIMQAYQSISGGVNCRAQKHIRTYNLADSKPFQKFGFLKGICTTNIHKSLVDSIKMAKRWILNYGKICKVTLCREDLDRWEAELLDAMRLPQTRIMGRLRFRTLDCMVSILSIRHWEGFAGALDPIGERMKPEWATCKCSSRALSAPSTLKLDLATTCI